MFVLVGFSGGGRLFNAGWRGLKVEIGGIHAGLRRKPSWAVGAGSIGLELNASSGQLDCNGVGDGLECDVVELEIVVVESRARRHVVLEDLDAPRNA